MTSSVTHSRRKAPSKVELPYSMERANNTLPLVKRIVDDLVAEYGLWQAAVGKFEYAAVRSSADAPDPEADALERDAKRHAKEIDAFLRELDALGIDCRVYETGLIAFPGELDGEPVYFEWTPGEASVSPASANGTSISMPSRAH